MSAALRIIADTHLEERLEANERALSAGATFASLCDDVLDNSDLNLVRGLLVKLKNKQTVIKKELGI